MLNATLTFKNSSWVPQRKKKSHATHCSEKHIIYLLRIRNLSSPQQHSSSWSKNKECNIFGGKLHWILLFRKTSEENSFHQFLHLTTITFANMFNDQNPLVLGTTYLAWIGLKTWKKLRSKSILIHLWDYERVENCYSNFRMMCPTLFYLFSEKELLS